MRVTKVTELDNRLALGGILVCMFFLVSYFSLLKIQPVADGPALLSGRRGWMRSGETTLILNLTARLKMS